MNKEWFYANGNNPVGPYSEEELKNLYITNEISDNTFVWKEGMSEWVAYKKIQFNDGESEDDSQTGTDSSSQEDTWFYSLDKETKGPVSRSDIQHLIQEGKITSDSQIWKKGTPSWVNIKDSEFSSLLNKESATQSNNSFMKKAIVAGLILTIGLSTYFGYNKFQDNKELQEQKVSNQQKTGKDQKEDPQEKKKTEQQKSKEDKTTQEKTKIEEQTAQSKTYVVPNDVDGGVYLHTEPIRGVPDNLRGLLKPGQTREITEIIEEEDCTWGKTSDNMYVCIYEPKLNEKYMIPVEDNKEATQSAVSYPSGYYRFDASKCPGGPFPDLVIDADGTAYSEVQLISESSELGYEISRSKVDLTELSSNGGVYTYQMTYGDGYTKTILVDTNIQHYTWCY